MPVVVFGITKSEVRKWGKWKSILCIQRDQEREQPGNNEILKISKYSKLFTVTWPNLFEI